MSTSPAAQAATVPMPHKTAHNTAHNRRTMARRIAETARTVPDLAGLEQTLKDTGERVFTATETVPLDRLDGWHFDRNSGFIVHESGGFFSVEGLQVTPSGSGGQWGQPIINQPETGVLGFLVREIDGIPHFLAQLKAEPGNRNGLQISPTVQATRSNYTGVHGGRRVPYLEFFQGQAPRQVIADVRQSEQGARFLRKRNRNMIVETVEPVEARDGFVWLTLGQLNRLLAVEDLVNMDTRSVLACLPLEDDGSGADGMDSPTDRDRLALHPLVDVLSWITEARTRHEMRVRTSRLDELAEWEFSRGRLRHLTGGQFEVIGVRVEAVGREVGRWCQPMFRDSSLGLLALAVNRIQGQLHVLMQVRAEPGLGDAAELAPTVQCAPDDAARLPPEERPPFLDLLQNAPADAVRFDTTLSDEGGRFYHTRNRHLVVETECLPEPPGYRWLTLRQLEELTLHSNYLNMQARSALACLRSLSHGGLR